MPETPGAGRTLDRLQRLWTRTSLVNVSRGSASGWDDGSAPSCLARLFASTGGLCLAKTAPALEPLTILLRAWVLPGSMLRLLVALLPTLLSATRSRRDLVLENLALRQQLVTLAGRRHPDIRPADRVFWVLLRRLWSGRAQALAIVRPEAVVRLASAVWLRVELRPARAQSRRRRAVAHA